MQPVFLCPFYDEKPWGGQKLNELFGRKLPYELTGESWEASALPQGESVVYGGKYDGMPLSQLYERRSRLFCGRGGRFPLLIKYIDANSTLSVQVHPNHATSLEYEGVPAGKTEAWVVISAEKDAKLCVGAKLSSSAELLDALYGGYIEDVLVWHSVKAGDVFYLPPGTLHSVGKGIVLYEIEQPSNVAYRVYDWGWGRQTHPEKSAAAYNPKAKAGRVVPKQIGPGEERLVTCEHFLLDRVNASAGYGAGASNDFCIYTSLADGEIAWQDGSRAFKAGDTFIIPAGLGQYRIDAGTLYRASLPRPCPGD